MKRKIKILVLFIILATGIAVTACSNMHWGANAGVDVRFGPNGPRLDPHVNLDLYSGGRL